MIKIPINIVFLALSLTGCAKAQEAKNRDIADAQKAVDTTMTAGTPILADTMAGSNSLGTANDRRLVERILRTTCKNYAAWGKEKTIVWIARQFIGVPYVGHTLDRSDTEHMVINLHELDCTTYVEAVLALAHCTFEGKSSFSDYCEAAQQVRYQDGKVSYENRLHYFQWWVADNVRKGLVQEITLPASIFTGRQLLRIDYMSTHASNYDMLRNHPERVQAIAKREKVWQGKMVNYIPKERLADTSLRQVVHDGDIIGLVTNKAGLDASHLGIAVWHKDGLYLLNASSLKKNGKQVVEPQETLFAYLAVRDHNKGIRVLRISE